MSFDYSSIPPGYYHNAMLNGSLPQRFWHHNKFLKVVRAISNDAHDVLDIGCAAGSFTYIASLYRQDLHVTGVDISQSQIAYAKSHILSNCPNSHFITLSNDHLPFKNHSFDVVTTIELIEHLNEGQNLKLSSEIARVLRPQGFWIITTPNYKSFWPLLEIILNVLSPVKYTEQHLTRFKPRTLRKKLIDEGWNVIKIESFFLLSPFLTWISRRLATSVFFLESHLCLPGNLLIATAQKSDNCTNHK